MAELIYINVICNHWFMQWLAACYLAINADFVLIGTSGKTCNLHLCSIILPLKKTQQKKIECFICRKPPISVIFSTVDYLHFDSSLWIQNQCREIHSWLSIVKIYTLKTTRKLTQYRNPWCSYFLTNWGQLTHICISKLGHHWFREWYVAKPLSEPMLEYC